MQTEVDRKLDLIVRIEETLAQVVYDVMDRVEDPTMREHLRAISEHHAWHAHELENMGVTPTSSGKVDMEMDTYRDRIQNRKEPRELFEALYNIEEEEATRIEEVLSENLELDVASSLATAKEDIQQDVEVFRDFVPHEWYATSPDTRAHA